MKNETVALLEIGGSHDECLLTQFHALKSVNKRIVFITTQDIMDRNPAFSEYIDILYILDQNELEARFKVAKKIKELLKKEHVSKVVMNTAHGNIMRNLALICLFNKMEFLGVMHTIIKLEGSFTQKVISWKVKKYFLLSQFLQEKARAMSKLSFGSFYPIRFDVKNEVVEKVQGRIVIIGGLENRRKDLLGFVDMLQNVKGDYEFIFLGKSDPNHDEVIAFKNKLSEKGMSEKVKLYDSFVSNEEFAKTVQSCEAILPLVHPETPSAQEYFKRQISGAMTVAFGYKKPLLIHEAYQHIEEMQVASVYYSQEHFSEVLSNRENLNEREEAMMDADSLKLSTQEKNYIAFLEA